MSIDFDPCQSHEDPYPLYRVLRDEAPVHLSESTGVLCISRYEDVMRVLKDSETFSSSAMRTFLMNSGVGSTPPLNWQAVRMFVGLVFRARMNPFKIQSGRDLISADGAPHGEMRNIVNRGFTPRQIARWAVPSWNRFYRGYYIGGGAVYGGDARDVRREGTWGWDFAPSYSRVRLGWWHGRRHQGGGGEYRSNGRVPLTWRELLP